MNNNKTIEQKIQELKDLIDEARMEGLENIGNLWAEELAKVEAMAKFDGRLA